MKDTDQAIIYETFSRAMKAIQPVLREQIANEVERVFHEWRNGAVTGETFCCDAFREAAPKIWLQLGVPYDQRHSASEMGWQFYRLEFHGHPFNWCPFCGRKI